jgi:2-polyprenyl-3-methyl-5-hydroxy-6-metoxy-1,4-benzoquinol methylase
MLNETEKRWRESYNESALKGGDDYKISQQIAHGLEQRERAFLQLYQRYINSKKKILDVGCGPGT